jgi:hypothetical protein
VTGSARARLALVATATAVALIGLLVALRYRPPPARGADAGSEQFSALRAKAVLARVLGDGAPHPIGSEANTRVRERIVSELLDIGVRAELQQGPACSAFGTCAEPVNVLARMTGREPGPPVLLLAHYDSVPAAQGAADDGSGVAALLEIARILARHPARHDVLLLFSDGEEIGLLGAELFVQSFPELASLRAVVNIEARGTSGPSILFETAGESARFALLAQRALERPVTSSLSVAVYRRLPNDTDLSVFSRHGVPGANFAFIGDVSRYHTPDDNLTQLDLGSLQHHGDGALALVRALSEPDPPGGARGDAVWFDVLALGVVWWKVESTFPILAIALTLFALGALANRRRRTDLRAADVARALFVLPGLLALSGALGFGLDFGLRRLGALPAPWIAHPLPVMAACWASAVGAVSLSTLLAGRHVGARAQFIALWFWWLLLAAPLAGWLPEASHLVLVPAVVAACSAPVAVLWPRLGAVALYAPLLAALVLWLPIVHLLIDAIGFFSLLPYSLAIAIALSPAAPVLALGSLRARLLLGTAACVIALGAFAVAALLPPFSTDVRQRVTFALHHDADAGRSRWLVDAPFGPVPQPVREAAAFGDVAVSSHPWLGSMTERVLAAPAELDSEPAPPLLEEMSSETDGTLRRVRGRLRSARGAELIALHFPAGSSARVRFAGLSAAPRGVGGWRAFVWAGPTAEGVAVEIELESGDPGEAMLVDHTYGLPTAGRFLLESRPETAVTSQLGDVTVVSRRVRL